MLLFRRTSSWPSLCSSGEDSRAAFDRADKLLKTLLITGSLGLKIGVGPCLFRIRAKFLAGLLGDTRNAPRVAGQMKE